MNNETGDIEYREGMITVPGETIIGGWAEVYRKDRSHSTRAEVSFEEYAARKKDGTLNSQWSKKPATMIRKVALVQALREAFPKTFGGMYSAEETGVDDSIIDVTPMEAPEIKVDERTGEVLEGEVIGGSGDAESSFFGEG